MSRQPESESEPAVTYGHEAIERALGLWRDGWKQSTRAILPVSWRAEYALAVQRVLTELQGRSTMQELMAWYDHEPPEMERLLDELIYAPSGRLLNYGMIEDAAYWRRAQQLLGLVGEDLHESWAWRFDVKVRYEVPDQRGVVREWGAHEQLTGIGNGRMSEEEARAIAQKLLDTDARARDFILGKYPEGATATLGLGWPYLEHLPDLDE